MTLAQSLGHELAMGLDTWLACPHQTAARLNPLVVRLAEPKAPRVLQQISPTNTEDLQCVEVAWS